MKAIINILLLAIRTTIDKNWPLTITINSRSRQPSAFLFEAIDDALFISCHALTLLGCFDVDIFATFDASLPTAETDEPRHDDDIVCTLVLYW